ncbi:DNA-directed DNA polymerase epsilon, subunit B [Turnera subulata]|uniref:DNA polymerase epsilon subunit n=1 Tax=Turnera subulata TaxID=218843 RepID=A0A9Q0JFH1_9ROSI|nr:DNA-directed DNA polymerase epsilon, subunit B [Turnera subulata]
MIGSLRKKVQKKFKIRGYTLKVDALEEILGFIETLVDPKYGAEEKAEAEDDALELLLDYFQSQSQKLGLKSSILDKEPLQRVISDLLNADAAVPQAEDDAVSALRITDAFVVPKFRYDPIKKQFYQYVVFFLSVGFFFIFQDKGPLPIHGDASAKASLYRDRFLLLFQRVSRDQHFAKSTFDSEISDYGSCEIVPIQSLVGQSGRRWVMGLISQLEDGHFYLEDLTASVEIDFSIAISFLEITTGFLSENTIVVAEGEMLMNGIFQVITCGFPPLEDREKSLKLFAQHDFFGCGALTKEETLRLAELEQRNVNDMLIILSDIWVDNEEAMAKLEIVLNGFESQEVVPSLFVFMGNFCSRPCNLSSHSFSSLRSQFGKLGKMIETHPRLNEHSRFLFIPGPDDAGPSTALPRCALPKYLTEELQKYVRNAVFLSNPCRIKFYTQEIVFFRHDLLYRMRRMCLLPPSTEETDDPFEHLVATIIHQSHLCPLPLLIQPIIWNYDHCLHLYPSPHAIVLGDKSEQKAFKYTGITCFNPGSFSNDSTFVAYRPCTQEVELSAL